MNIRVMSLTSCPLVFSCCRLSSVFSAIRNDLSCSFCPLRYALCALHSKAEIPWIFVRKSGKHLVGCGSFHQQKFLPNVACPRRGKTRQRASTWGGMKLPAVRLQRTTGNALALLNFPTGALFHRASCNIFMKYPGQSIPPEGNR
jgi:hypothetical protein